MSSHSPTAAASLLVNLLSRSRDNTTSTWDMWAHGTWTSCHCSVCLTLPTWVSRMGKKRQIIGNNLLALRRLGMRMCRGRGRMDLLVTWGEGER